MNTIHTTLQFDAEYKSDGQLVGYKIHGVVGDVMGSTIKDLSSHVAQLILACGEEIQNSGKF